MSDITDWISAGADVFTAGVALVTVGWVMKDRHKRRPDLLAAWGDLEPTDEPGVYHLLLYAVGLLPEPVTLVDVWAENGLQLEAPMRRRDPSGQTTFTLPDPASLSQPLPIPERDWVSHRSFSQLLAHHRPDSNYLAAVAIRVNLSRLRGAPQLKLRARLASDTRDVIEKIITLAIPAP